MVLAETVSIDGEVVIAFLVVVGLLFIGFIAYVIYGARAARAAARPDASDVARTVFGIVLAIDVGLVLWPLIAGGIGVAIFTALPLVVHGLAWFVEGSPPRREGPSDGEPAP